MKRRRDSEAPDLFAGMDAVGHAGNATGSACAARPPYHDDASAGDVSLIRSPLVEETKEWLSSRALTLGNMLASERAVEYVAILRALADFRAEHEPEPLHEDVERKVCGEDAEAFASAAFKSDLRQLKEWNLVAERIEDVGARLAELARLGEDEVPHVWMQRLLEPAAMCGDAQVRPGGEKSVAPLPKKSSQVKTRKIVSWITPRRVGERPDVASIAEERAKRGRLWRSRTSRLSETRAESETKKGQRNEDMQDKGNICKYGTQVRRRQKVRYDNSGETR